MRVVAEDELVTLQVAPCGPVFTRLMSRVSLKGGEVLVSKLGSPLYMEWEFDCWRSPRAR